MAKELLIDAVQHIKAGKKKEALPFLSRYVALNPDDENGWSWLFVCVDTEERKIYCLKQILRINPQHQKAQLALNKLENRNISLTTEERLTVGYERNKSIETQILSIDTPDNPIRIMSQNHQTIEFIPAICPNCGGELRVPKNMDRVICLYCGVEVLLFDSSVIKIDSSIDIVKFLELITRALASENFQEAYDYCSKILEQEPNHRKALLQKGFAAGMLSSRENLRTKEMDQYLRQAMGGYVYFRHSSDYKNNMTLQNKDLDKDAQKYFEKLSWHLGEIGGQLIESGDSHGVELFRQQYEYLISAYCLLDDKDPQFHPRDRAYLRKSIILTCEWIIRFFNLYYKSSSIYQDMKQTNKSNLKLTISLTDLRDDKELNNLIKRF